jgi:hypothetical protein
VTHLASTRIPTFAKDLLERVGWTALQAGAGLLTVDSLHIPSAYAVPVAAVLAAVKGWIGKHVTGTAALGVKP